MVHRLPESWSNRNLETLVFEERGKPEYSEKNLLKQRREPTTNSTHIWRRRRYLKPGHIGGRQSISPLRHPFPKTKNVWRLTIIENWRYWVQKLIKSKYKLLYRLIWTVVFFQFVYKFFRSYWIPWRSAELIAKFEIPWNFFTVNLYTVWQLKVKKKSFWRLMVAE